MKTTKPSKWDYLKEGNSLLAQTPTTSNKPFKNNLKRTPLKRGNQKSSENQKAYLEFWNAQKTPRKCVECGMVLTSFSPLYCSHILTKNAHPKMRYDIRSMVLMCAQHHVQWEFGKRREMKSYFKLEKLRTKLIRETYE